MKNFKRNLVYAILIFIIILSIVLIYKIKKTPIYDMETYNMVYSEYTEINTNKDKLSKDGTNKKIYITKNEAGKTYKTLATIDIEKLQLSYPIISEYSEENLKIAPTRLVGPEANEIGNLVIVGHNYKNNEMFSNISKLKLKDVVKITDRKYRNS